MDTSNPGPLLMLGGGVLMALGSILKWGGDQSGISLDAIGLLGIVALVSGLFIALVGAIGAFDLSIGLPEEVAGFRLIQIAIADALTVFLWTFGLITSDGTKFGLHLTWIAALAALVGGVLTDRSGSSAGDRPVSI